MDILDSMTTTKIAEPTSSHQAKIEIHKGNVEEIAIFAQDLILSYAVW
jgi:hypothetical protein